MKRISAAFVVAAACLAGSAFAAGERIAGEQEGTNNWFTSEPSETSAGMYVYEYGHTGEVNLRSRPRVLVQQYVVGRDGGYGAEFDFPALRVDYPALRVTTLSGEPVGKLVPAKRAKDLYDVELTGWRLNWELRPEGGHMAASVALEKIP